MLATVKGDVHDIGKNIVGVVLGCANYDIVDLGVMVPAQTIIDTARERGADIVGLSGLITPSLDEMVHVASEMERQGMAVPLLIGGATTSRIHTALRVDPAYSRNAVVYVADASPGGRSDLEVAVRRRGPARRVPDRARRRIPPCDRRPRAGGGRAQQDDDRDARDNGAVLTFDTSTVKPPTFTGVRVFDALDVGEVAPYIDWTPFFHVWGLRGRYPAILEDGVLGDPRARCSTTRNGCSTASSPSNGSPRRRWWGSGLPTAMGDDILLARTADGSSSTRLHGLRQQLRRQGKPNLSIADFVAPPTAGVRDHIGAFVVTAGPEEVAVAERFEAANDDYSSIMVKALADRVAEALAEYMHARVRRELWALRARRVVRTA